jgi:prepilin-type N-terminal cleavage/methylation domain-containing protein
MLIRRTAKRRTGFTLIETIAALVVLAVAIPPILWAIRDAHVQRVNPLLASQARWLATEKLEDVIADRHASTRGYDYLTAANYPNEPTVEGFAPFSRRVSFAETGPDLQSDGEGFMTATVDVSWTDATGAVRTLTVSTVLTECDAP